MPHGSDLQGFAIVIAIATALLMPAPPGAALVALTAGILLGAVLRVGK
jgi:hypothetical protein